MSARAHWTVGFAVLVGFMLSACAGDTGSAEDPGHAPTQDVAGDEHDATGTTGAALAMADIEVFEEIAPGTYYVDADGNPETPPRVEFTVAEEGWFAWTGTYKEQAGHDVQLVGLTIATVTHIVADPCSRHTWDDPGPSVDDLVAALAALPGLEPTTAPTEVTAYGYHGRYLELTVPQLAHEPAAGFTDCVGGYLYTYRGEAEWGRTLSRFYQGPGQILEIWVLDVEGTRLLIEATRFPDSPPEDVDELQAILDSIHIEA